MIQTTDITYSPSVITSVIARRSRGDLIRFLCHREAKPWRSQTGIATSHLSGTRNDNVPRQPERQTPEQRIKSPLFPPFPRTESLRGRSKGGISSIFPPFPRTESLRGRSKGGTGGIKGFTLFETLFAIFILLIAIVPMINAFGPSLFSTATEETNIVFTNYARQTLNRVAVVNFKTLNDLVQSNQANPVNLDSLFGSGQETFSFNSVNYTPTVVIADVSGGASGLLEITVTMNQVTLKTLKADY